MTSVSGDCLSFLLNSDLSQADNRRMMTSCCQTMAASFRSWSRAQPDPIEAVESASSLFRAKLEPLLRRDSKPAEALIESSSFLSRLEDGRSRDPDNLPSLGAAGKNGGFSPCSQRHSAFPAALAVLNLVSELAKVNVGIKRDPELRKWLAGCQPYLERLLSEKLSLKSSWFVDSELLFLVQLVNLDCAQARLPSVVLSLLQTRHGKLAKGVFDKIFQESLEIKLLDLDLGEERQTLARIRDMYRNIVLPRKSAEDAGLTERNAGEPLLASDWPFQPITTLFELEQEPHADGEEDPGEKVQREASEVQVVTLTLRWIALNWSQMQLATPEDAGTWLTRLLVAFLLDCSPNLSAECAKWLRKCLNELCRISRGNFKLKSVPGLTSTKEFYSRVLEEYSASSYGNDLFALAAILPSKVMPEVLWRDHLDDLPTMRVAELPEPMTAADFIGHDVQAYVKAVLSEHVRRERNPLLFYIAEENIIRQGESEEVRRVKDLLRAKNINI